MESALEAASLHPAQLLGLEKRKGTLDFGADAGQGLMWGGLGNMKTQELLGGLGQDRVGRRVGSFLCPGSLTQPPALVWPQFPIGPGFLASETRSGKGLLGLFSLVPLLPGVLVPGPQSVCAGSGHPTQVVSQALVSPPALGWGLGGRPATASFSQLTFDPDFVMLDDSLHVQATYISGELVWQAEEARQ